MDYNRVNSQNNSRDFTYPQCASSSYCYDSYDSPRNDRNSIYIIL